MCYTQKAFIKFFNLNCMLILTICTLFTLKFSTTKAYIDSVAPDHTDQSKEQCDQGLHALYLRVIGKC